jgi:SAM-dependent methyltransferase
VSRPGYDAELSNLLAELEPVSFWFRARNRLVVSLLRRHFPALGSLLDVGCGNGFALAAIREAFPDARLVGVDFVEEALETARTRVPDAELHRLDVLELPFEDEFDVVSALDVLEHLDDDEAALRRMRVALRPGGGALVLVPQHRWLWSGADEIAHHRRRYRRSDLLESVRRAGLEVSFVSSFVTSLLPAMALSRILSRGTFGARELRRGLVPGPLNGPFERLLDAERQLVAGRGVSLPAGGSLLVIARRPR